MNFKKTLALILVLVCALLLLTSCGLKEIYHEEIGLTLSLPENFERFPYGSKKQITYENESGDCAVVINHFTVEDLMPKFGGAPFTLKQYVEYSFEELGLTDSIHPTYDEGGTRATFTVATGEDEAAIPQYSYNVIIKECGRVFVVQMICSANDMEYYAPKFEKWAEKIETERV